MVSKTAISIFVGVAIGLSTLRNSRLATLLISLTRG